MTSNLKIIIKYREIYELQKQLVGNTNNCIL